MKSSHELHSEYAGSAYREYRASTNDAIRDARSPPPFAADPPREARMRGASVCAGKRRRRRPSKRVPRIDLTRISCQDVKRRAKQRRRLPEERQARSAGTLLPLVMKMQSYLCKASAPAALLPLSLSRRRGSCADSWRLDAITGRQGKHWRRLVLCKR